MSNPTYGLTWKTKLTDNSATAQEQLGIIRYELDSTNGLKKYKYVQAADDTTVANGTALGYLTTDTARLTVSSDQTDFLYNNPAGVGIGAITAEYYGWVQIGGYHSAIKTNGDDDIAADASLILTSTDGTVDSVAAGTASTYRPIAYSVAADVDASDTVAGNGVCPE